MMMRLGPARMQSGREDVSEWFNQRISFSHWAVSILTLTFTDRVFRLLVPRRQQDEVAGARQAPVLGEATTGT
jgi:hypothetical protein